MSHAPSLGVLHAISIAGVLILTDAFIALLCEAVTIDLSSTHGTVFVHCCKALQRVVPIGHGGFAAIALARRGSMGPYQ